MMGARSRILAALSLVSLTFAEVKPAVAEIDLTAAIDAIAEYRCLAQYWADKRPSPPSRLPFAIRGEGTTAYVSVEGLDSPELTTFYTIKSEGMKAVVTSWSAYNKTLAKESTGFQESRSRVFDDSSKHAFGSDFPSGELRVPMKCALVLEADTAVKRAMVDAVQRSMMISLTQFNRTGANYPAHVRIVIANFNPDFGATYVLVRETGEIFGVVLNDPAEFPPADAAGYVVWQPYNSSDLPPIRRKIMTTGIEREIEVGK